MAVISNTFKNVLDCRTYRIDSGKLAFVVAEAVAESGEIDVVVEEDSVEQGRGVFQQSRSAHTQTELFEGKQDRDGREGERNKAGTS